MTTPLDTNHKLRRHVYNLNQLRHENVADFVGLSQTSTFVTVISECTSKGTLRQLLSFGQQKMDEKLRFSLCWDLFHGLEYIQKSVEFHGNLTSFFCLVDHRFSLKIAQTGFTRFYEVLHVPNEEPEIEALFCLWKPVDVHDMVRSNSLHLIKHYKNVKEIDMFAMAMIFYEILSNKLPLDIANLSQETVQGVLDKIKEKGNFQITDELVSDPIRHLLNVCLSNPTTYDYPTIKTFGEAMKKVITRAKPYMLQIVRHLEMHAQRSIVKRLRNKVSVQPEHFDQVTLLFSDLPAFSHIVMRCTPWETIELLNTIHSRFDEVMTHYDVYKVETINDCYIIASGLPIRNGALHAGIICSLALRFIQTAQLVTNPADSRRQLQSRIGIHTGPIVAGVIGKKMPRYCLFGDTINTCSRMESHGEEGRIHLSEATSQLVNEGQEFLLIARGGITIKVNLEFRGVTGFLCNITRKIYNECSNVFE
ncbi:guanylate cyclase 32E-like isoform X3 [Paramacrobiotus metropolitanus]|uniref:guanylate cyclase 32E-like isoform X3 n=1 Tax=Paramacrobiotus metropolitanus TaxID=2943436 RepID=UPI002445806E|nr:guanylate cyclase 32E-like isoform X3 [Paramacrobiotus metropolitanus]